MTSQTVSDGKGKNIHFTITLDDEQDAPADIPEKKKPVVFADETAILDKTNLLYKDGERNTEHGITAVKIIDFHDDEQRRKALRLLVNHYSRVVWKLLPILREFGAHPRADVRYRAAQAVGELMCEMDFIRIKDEVVLPWAKHFYLGINVNVGVAFSVVAKHDKYADNIKKLLKHWSTVSDSDLNRTALATMISLCATWPEESIEIVRQSLGKKDSTPWDYTMLVTLSALVLRELCDDGKTEIVIESLKEWITDEDAGVQRLGAALAFMEAVDFCHAFECESVRDKVIQMYQVCLEERRLDKLGLIRSSALNKLKDWAEESFGDEDKQEFVKLVFMRLYMRASTDRDKERLDFHLRRWQQQDKEKRFGFIIESLIR
ncbi:MAG: hypothetical protein WA821_16050 [Anaerolineales bacterium]